MADYSNVNHSRRKALGFLGKGLGALVASLALPTPASANVSFPANFLKYPEFLLNRNQGGSTTLDVVVGEHVGNPSEDDFWTQPDAQAYSIITSDLPHAIEIRNRVLPVTRVLNEGSTAIYTYDGRDYEVRLDFVGGKPGVAKFTVNGEFLPALSPGYGTSLSDNIEFTLLNLINQKIVGGIRTAEFQLGADRPLPSVNRVLHTGFPQDDNPNNPTKNYLFIGGPAAIPETGAIDVRGHQNAYKPGFATMAIQRMPNGAYWMMMAGYTAEDTKSLAAWFANRRVPGSYSGSLLGGNTGVTLPVKLLRQFPDGHFPYDWWTQCGLLDAQNVHTDKNTLYRVVMGPDGSYNTFTLQRDSPVCLRRQ